jgi:hypothetical protein
VIDLHEVTPELEIKIRHISLELEQGSSQDMVRNLRSSTPQKLWSMEQEVSHFHHLNDEWLATLERVVKESLLAKSIVFTISLIDL